MIRSHSSSQGLTCQEVLELPPDQRSADGIKSGAAAKAAREDHASMLKMAADLAWKKCPSCNILVDRIDGCNYVRCRCGTGFCYRCGLAYGPKPCATNVHGTPACKCGLFRYEFLDDD